MRIATSLSRWAGIGAVALGLAPVAHAQGGSFGGGFGPPLQTVKPPREFASSEEHYQYLLEQANGGTKHTLATVPRWDGLWQPAGNTHLEMFIEGQGFQGSIREDVLTPEYLAAYRERWREQTELGQVKYDRLGHCEPPGYPRILLEPYTHEFINLPEVAYQINDFGPSIRRTYIGAEHNNVYGTHSWYGDTIGFWDGNKLITHTKYLLPADFTRWSPMTSNQFESVETWELKRYPNDVERLEVQVTFYDRHAFVRPVSAVYAFRRAKELEAAGHRVQHWECETSNNDVFDKGGTTSRLPGEPGFKDPRGTTLFPDLPGQSRDPIYNTTLPAKKE
jgi:hypothetical protein